MSAIEANILDGKWLSQKVLESISSQVERCRSKVGRLPGLAVILVGENPASKTYVSNKEKLAKAAGFKTFNTHLPKDVSFEELSRVIISYNQSVEVDGILLQLPLPQHLNADAAIDLISPEKDADGLHPLNQGLLMRGQARVKPCTPLGVIKLIDLAFSGYKAGQADFDYAKLPAVDLSGKKALVIGRSILVGKPVSLLLLERNATVSMAHSRSPNLPELCREADILVAAIGRPLFVQGSWVKPGAIVLDVGINRVESGALAGKLVGDVDYQEAAKVASAITPVPGGVGPMTVAMLIENTLSGYQRLAQNAA